MSKRRRKRRQMPATALPGTKGYPPLEALPDQGADDLPPDTIADAIKKTIRRDKRRSRRGQ